MHVKVFISSLISGYEPYRAAVAEAVETLGYQVVRAEDFPASPGTPQQACLAAVRDSDLVVLLIGERYGYPQPSGALCHARGVPGSQGAQAHPCLRRVGGDAGAGAAGVPRRGASLGDGALPGLILLSNGAEVLGTARTP